MLKKLKNCSVVGFFEFLGLSSSDGVLTFNIKSF